MLFFILSTEVLFFRYFNTFEICFQFLLFVHVIMRFRVKPPRRLLSKIIFTILFCVCFYVISKSHDESGTHDYLIVTTSERISSVAVDSEKKDWNDWNFINYEKTREGPGEQGKLFKLTDPEDIKLNDQRFEEEGVFVIASDKISVNRSVFDARLKK
jgi:hypothetical protein